MEKLLPILSGSLKECLVKIVDEHNNNIAKELLWAHDLVELYNSRIAFYDDYKEAFDVLREQINSIITDEVRALSFRPNVFEISFTPKGKNLEYTDFGTWSRTGRQVGKPARIVKKLLVKTYKSIELERFNNLLRNEIVNSGDFKIVEGHDITKYYHEDTYFKVNGSLGSSCMRGEDCVTYFKIYEDVAKLLICVKQDRILGRAILWNLEGGITIMDRVYVCDDYLEETFINYAKEQKWIIRSENAMVSDGDSAEWLTPHTNYEYPEVLDFEIKCPELYDQYPYVDSFRYLDTSSFTISTNPTFGDARLSNTNGEYEMCRYIKCANCGEIHAVWDTDDNDVEFRYSNYLHVFMCTNCCMYDHTIEDYVPVNAKLIKVYWFDDSVEKIPLEYVNQRIISKNQYINHGDYFIYHDRKFYHRRHFKWNCAENQYEFIKNE